MKHPPYKLSQFKSREDFYMAKANYYKNACELFELAIKTHESDIKMLDEFVSCSYEADQNLWDMVADE